ncbi:hypothetical protein BSZ36_18080 [Rubricoccus marinus]|uniref:Initiator Rep protein WH1 domain-containing protein n=2 Tax=Rubricoccus marinus TaxID=716817 RepID=A0A259TUX9_9BACT|nr:hypothetical protein BSZ36_18080 [Rubricoccus marinus]
MGVAPGEIKKHVGAVHVKGSLSLLERKVSNVLLLNAYEDLPNPEVFEHEIRLRTLADVAGFDSNDHALLRASLESLAGTTITWNILDAEGGEEWGVSTFLAQAVTRGGVCRYAYAPDLRKKLYNPEIYARINLSVQERFGSGYALALYENCVRFRKVGSTGWISVEQWRDLLGVEPGQYDSFKYLNRDVLKPAITEVNRFSDIRVSMERKREGRRVAALKFRIEESDQLQLDLGGGAKRAAQEAGSAGEFPGNLPDPRAMAPEPGDLLDPLQRRLVTFGLTEAQALDVATEYDAGRVEGNLAYVESEIERGRAISNVAAFTIGAIRTDYRGGGEAPIQREVAARKSAKERKAREADGARQRAEDASRTRKLRAEQETRTQSDARAARLDAAWSVLSDTERSGIETEVVERLRNELPYLYRTYETSGEDSVAVRTTLKAFRYEALDAHSPRD